VAALSLGVDPGFGQPMEHVLRQCLIALRLADRAGLDERDRMAVYYTALQVNVGCHADAHEQAKWFGDDIALKSGKYPRGLSGGAISMLARVLGAADVYLSMRELRRTGRRGKPGKRPLEQADRRAAGDHAEHGGQSRGAHLRQDRRLQPGRRDVRGAAWPDPGGEGRGHRATLSVPGRQPRCRYGPIITNCSFRLRPVS
jgi:hypothetical protein